MAIVAKSDDGKQIMILDDEFAALFKDGIWVENVLPNGYELGHHFSDVEDDSEVKAIIEDALKALGRSHHLAPS